MTLGRALTAEAVGSALLLAIVVGSGIMGQRLAAGNDAVALLANALATGAGLFVLITIFAPISGAHFNPVVSLIACWRGELARCACLGYVAAQVLGAFAGVAIAHVMFGLQLFEAGGHVRSTPGECLGEFVATFGLILVIVLGVRARASLVPVLVASYITSAYWFTSSTSFANPAVTLARSATDTFAGIAPSSVPFFILGQLAGAACGALLAYRLEQR